MKSKATKPLCRVHSRPGSWTRRRCSRALAVVAATGAAGITAGWTGQHAQAQGGGMAIELSLDQAQVYKGEVAELSAEVRLDPKMGDVQAPQIVVDKAVKVRLVGSSSSQVTRIINGQYSSEIRKRFRYELSSDSGGRYVIGAKLNTARVKLRARQRLNLQVFAQKRKVPTTAQGDDVMVIPHLVPESKLYVGQAALFHLELWMRTADTPASVERPSFRDFITLDFDLPPRRVVSLNRRRYEVQSVYYRAIFPQRAGKLSIDGLELTMQPVSIGSIFSRRRKRAYRIKGPGTNVEVLPLPAKGQPRGFKAAHVGQFNLRTQVDRTDLKVQDALTLTVEIEGTGNMTLLDPGTLPKIPGIRAYTPKREEPQYRVQDNEIRGVVRWRYLMVADKAGTVTVPAMHMDYFDPIAGRYARSSSDPLVLDIKDKKGQAVAPVQNPAAGAGAVASPTGGNNAASDETSKNANERLDPNDMEALMDVVASDALARRMPKRSTFQVSRFYQLALAAPAAVGLSAGVAALRRRMAGDSQQQRKKAEDAAIRASLGSLADKEPREAWSQIAKALQRIAILRAGPAAAGLPRAELMVCLEKSNVDSQTVTEWKQWLDRGDAERFGASASASSGSNEALKQAQDFALAQLDAWGRGS